MNPCRFHLPFHARRIREIISLRGIYQLKRTVAAVYDRRAVFSAVTDRRYSLLSSQFDDLAKESLQSLRRKAQSRGARESGSSDREGPGGLDCRAIRLGQIDAFEPDRGLGSSDFRRDRDRGREARRALRRRSHARPARQDRLRFPVFQSVANVECPGERRVAAASTEVAAEED